MTVMGKTLNAALVEEFRRRLREMRGRLHRTAATTDEELQTLEAHQAGAPAEDVARESVTTLLSRLSGQEKRELDEVYAAQARLETGTFGICEGCGRPIPLARLRALPTTRTCVACQAREEERAR
jgi:DnaK suppressor protein